MPILSIWPKVLHTVEEKMNIYRVKASDMLVLSESGRLHGAVIAATTGVTSIIGVTARWFYVGSSLYSSDHSPMSTMSTGS